MGVVDGASIFEQFAWTITEKGRANLRPVTRLIAFLMAAAALCGAPVHRRRLPQELSRISRRFCLDG
jgi:hypothetical protein